MFISSPWLRGESDELTYSFMILWQGLLCLPWVVRQWLAAFSLSPPCLLIDLPNQSRDKQFYMTMLLSRKFRKFGTLRSSSITFLCFALNRWKFRYGEKLTGGEFLAIIFSLCDRGCSSCCSPDTWPLDVISVDLLRMARGSCLLKRQRFENSELGVRYGHFLPAEHCVIRPYSTKSSKNLLFILQKHNTYSTFRREFLNPRQKPNWIAKLKSWEKEFSFLIL